jgi:hypothetical protein
LFGFEWIYNTIQLLSKPISKESVYIQNLGFWRQHYERHYNFIEILPQLKEHTILQRVLWEIELAKGVVEFVSACKNTQRSLAGKFA